MMRETYISGVFWVTRRRYPRLSDAFAVITPDVKSNTTRMSGIASRRAKTRLRIERDVGEAFEPLWCDRKFSRDRTRDNMTFPAEKRGNRRIQLDGGIRRERT